MKTEIRERILNLFKQNSGYTRTKDVQSLGIHNIYLKELEEEGVIIKVKRGLYCLQEHESKSSFIEALLIIPDGVLCLGSALSYFDLSTWNPPDVHIAIPHGRKIKTPDYPPIKLFYFSGIFYETGISEIRESTHAIRIYNLEKTMCDIVRFRNRIGIDIMKEALGEYLKKKDKDLNRLGTYAKELKISSVLNQYLEVLL